jgi:hypothetical protein
MKIARQIAGAGPGLAASRDAALAAQFAVHGLGRARFLPAV